MTGRLWEVQSDRYFGDSTARDSLDKLFKAVAATDTVIHTIDVTGMGAAAAVDETLPQPVGRGRDTLAQFASNTGGRFVSNTNDLEAGLAELLDASRHYYVLGFEPLDPKKKPDRLRRLKVRVKRDGLSVSHRRGYVIADPKRDASPSGATLQAAEAIVKRLSGGAIVLRIVGVPYRNASGKLSLPLVLHVDGRSLTSGSSSRQLGLEVFGYALDAEGRVQDTVALQPTLDLGAVRPSLEAKRLQLITSFAAAEGDVDVRFVVREKASRRIGSLRLQLAMPDFDDDRIVLSPPLAMDDPRARLVLTAASRARPEPELILRNGERRELCVLAWGGDEDDAGGEAFEVEALLVSDSSEPLELELAAPPRVVRDKDGAARYLVTLAPSDLAAGRYRPRLDFKGPVSGDTARSETPVRVE